MRRMLYMPMFSFLSSVELWFQMSMSMHSSWFKAQELRLDNQSLELKERSQVELKEVPTIAAFLSKPFILRHPKTREICHKENKLGDRMVFIYVFIYTFLLSRRVVVSLCNREKNITRKKWSKNMGGQKVGGLFCSGNKQAELATRGEMMRLFDENTSARKSGYNMLGFITRERVDLDLGSCCVSQNS